MKIHVHGWDKRRLHCSGIWRGQQSTLRARNARQMKIQKKGRPDWEIVGSEWLHHLSRKCLKYAIIIMLLECRYFFVYFYFWQWCACSRCTSNLGHFVTLPPCRHPPLTMDGTQKKLKWPANFCIVFCASDSLPYNGIAHRMSTKSTHAINSLAHNLHTFV